MTKLKLADASKEVEDITLINYNPLSYIKAPLNTGVNKYKDKENG